MTSNGLLRLSSRWVQMPKADAEIPAVRFDLV